MLMDQPERTRDDLGFLIIGAFRLGAWLLLIASIIWTTW
jgi:hypothetical protein